MQLNSVEREEMASLDRVVDQQWRNYNASVDRDRFKYGYDRASNRTYREDAVAATLHDHLYSYDALHRLTDSQRGTLNGGKTAISTLVFAQQWSLSPVGNWSTFKQDDNGDTSWELNQSRTHNPANEITAIGTWIAPAYDAAGSMTSGPRPGADTTRHHYAYDAWNRLISVKADSSGSPGSTIATYAYDGLNRRVQKVVAGSPLSTTYDYYYNSDWQLLEERKGGSAYAQYVWGLRYIDAPVSRSRDADASALNGLEEVLFYQGDANMSVTALVDASGAVVERYTYDAYGKATFRKNDWTLQQVGAHTDGTASLYDNPVLYCGYCFDPESGTYQVRHRDYHPSLGRWTQKDPAEYFDTANLYLYGLANPVIRIDPSGLSSSANFYIRQAREWGIRNRMRDLGNAFYQCNTISDPCERSLCHLVKSVAQLTGLADMGLQEVQDRLDRNAATLMNVLRRSGSPSLAQPVSVGLTDTDFMNLSVSIGGWAGTSLGLKFLPNTVQPFFIIQNAIVGAVAAQNGDDLAALAAALRATAVAALMTIRLSMAVASKTPYGLITVGAVLTGTLTKDWILTTASNELSTANLEALTERLQNVQRDIIHEGYLLSEIEISFNHAISSFETHLQRVQKNCCLE